MFERHSALTGALRPEQAEAPAVGAAVHLGEVRVQRSEARVHLGEVRGFSLVQVAAFPNAWPALANAVEKILGTPPEKPGQSNITRNRLLFRTGADQFWVVSSANEDLTNTLQCTLPPNVGSVISLSHSRTRIFLEGPAARQVLATGVAIDLNPIVFPVGAVALTGAHHTPIVLHRVTTERYELYTLRTFAVWIWDWLTDASLPHGYKPHRS